MTTEKEKEQWERIINDICSFPHAGPKAQLNWEDIITHAVAVLKNINPAKAFFTSSEIYQKIKENKELYFMKTDLSDAEWEQCRGQISASLYHSIIAPLKCIDRKGWNIDVPLFVEYLENRRDHVSPARNSGHVNMEDQPDDHLPSGCLSATATPLLNPSTRPTTSNVGNWSSYQRSLSPPSDIGGVSSYNDPAALRRLVQESVNDPSKLKILLLRMIDDRSADRREISSLRAEITDTRTRLRDVMALLQGIALSPLSSNDLKEKLARITNGGSPPNPLSHSPLPAPSENSLLLNSHREASPSLKTVTASVSSAPSHDHVTAAASTYLQSERSKIAHHVAQASVHRSRKLESVSQVETSSSSSGGSSPEQNDVRSGPQPTISEMNPLLTAAVTSPKSDVVSAPLASTATPTNLSASPPAAATSGLSANAEISSTSAAALPGTSLSTPARSSTAPLPPRKAATKAVQKMAAASSKHTTGVSPVPKSHDPGGDTSSSSPEVSGPSVSPSVQAVIAAIPVGLDTPKFSKSVRPSKGKRKPPLEDEEKPEDSDSGDRPEKDITPQETPHGQALANLLSAGSATAAATTSASASSTATVLSSQLAPSPMELHPSNTAQLAGPQYKSALSAVVPETPNSIALSSPFTMSPAPPFSLHNQLPILHNPPLLYTSEGENAHSRGSEPTFPSSVPPTPQFPQQPTAPIASSHASTAPAASSSTAPPQPPPEASLDSDEASVVYDKDKGGEDANGVGEGDNQAFVDLRRSRRSTKGSIPSSKKRKPYAEKKPNSTEGDNDAASLLGDSSVSGKTPAKRGRKSRKQDANDDASSTSTTKNSSQTTPAKAPVLASPPEIAKLIASPHMGGATCRNCHATGIEGVKFPLGGGGMLCHPCVGIVMGEGSSLTRSSEADQTKQQPQQ